MTDHGLPDDLITPKEAAKLLKINLATLYRYIADGLLPCWTRAGARKFVSRAAVVGLFAPTNHNPKSRVPSHAEAVEQLRKAGFMKGGKA